MEIYKKLQQAREIIKASPVKKAGKNSFSGYDYFTPEQINALVFSAEKETGLIHIFNLERDQAKGLHGYLLLIDTEDTSQNIAFTQATEIPEIKATNAAQQIGGAVTYTLRYMLMTAFDIADNSLDFDSKDNRPAEAKVTPTATGKTIPETAKLKINEKAFLQLCARLKANPDPVERGNLLAKTRRYYLPFTDAQEEIIKQITDNL